MRLSILTTPLVLALASANPHFGQWKPAGADDCTMGGVQTLFFAYFQPIAPKYQELTPISRTDAYFGNNHVFNETIFEETKKYWTGPTLDANMLANSKLARQISSKAYNPTYTFTSSMEQFSLGEVAAPIIAFGDIQNGKVNRTLVEYFFGKFIGPYRLSPF
ncbi:unnamed protein product [Aspergillus oryzae]|uniref:Unnamed protein product n=1 Tax=Aspergillus oryzae var. brunneus TaxID=332754 RepID=A0ABQ6KU11_ASPOZ|nr:unnamed protein product [Aspergillus oryzae]GMF94419.1 unnamed protein product [Aspergillus oryzae]GMG16371.1 unnamed protein product [Aspergillus oryzae]GMG45459.1 unnamed protein product [Aspergillus oryzae var. brunneus]